MNELLRARVILIDAIKYLERRSLTKLGWVNHEYGRAQADVDARRILDKAERLLAQAEADSGEMIWFDPREDCPMSTAYEEWEASQ